MGRQLGSAGAFRPDQYKLLRALLARVCVCARARACVRTCACVCVCFCLSVSVCLLLCVCGGGGVGGMVWCVWMGVYVLLPACVRTYVHCCVHMGCLAVHMREYVRVYACMFCR